MEPTSNQVFLNSAEETTFDRQEDKDTAYRGSILPFRETTSGEIEWAMPQWMLDAYHALTLPRDVTEGYKPTHADIINFGLTTGGVGLAASKVAKPDADVGMFLGVKAENAPLSSFDQAIKLYGEGASREQIWRDTGWWESPSGEWLWEIDDSGMALTDKALKGWAEEGLQGPTREMVNHPELFDNYGLTRTDSIADKYEIDDGYDAENNITSWKVIEPRVAVGRQQDNTLGSYDDISKRIEATGNDEGTVLDTLVHEFQHSVQSVEGMKGRGTTTEAVEGLQTNLYKALPTSALEYFTNETELRNILEMDSWSKDDFLSKRAIALAGKKTEFENKLPPEVLSDLNYIYDFIQQPSFQGYKTEAGEVLAEASARRRTLGAEGRRKISPWHHISEDEEEKAWTIQLVTQKMSNILKGLVDAGIE